MNNFYYFMPDEELEEMRNPGDMEELEDIPNKEDTIEDMDTDTEELNFDR